MLETLRRHSRNVLIYLIFGILIAVFIISFGPQAGQGRGCATPGSGWVAKVGTKEIGESSWRFALLSTPAGTSTGARARASRVREMVMDELIKRELLAGAAEASGFRIADSEVEDRIARGEIYVMGYPVEGKNIYMKDGKYFDDKLLEQFVKGRGLPTLNHFVEEQRREMLAERMRELLRASVRVAPEEVEEAYRQQNTKVSVEYVKFEPFKYTRDVSITPAEADAFAKQKEDVLKKKFEAQKASFTGLPKQARIRQIYVRSETPSPEGEGATTQPATPPAGNAQAKARAEAALARLKGGADFMEIAKEASEQDRLALPVWRSIPSLPKELREAVDKLKPGELSHVIDTPQGYYIVKVEGRREGDQKYEDVRRDLAEEMLRDERARELAKKDAEEALAKAKAGTPLDQQFERQKPVDEGEDLPFPMPQMLPPGETPAPTPTPAPGAPATPPAKTPATPPAPPAPPAKTPATQPTQQGFYDSDGTFWEYAEAEVKKPGPALPVAATPPAKSGAAKPSDRPKVMTIEELTRNGNKLAGLGESAELAKALFQQLKPGQLGPKVYQVELVKDRFDYVVVKLITREEPKMDEFAKKKETLAADFSLVKSYRLLDEWTAHKCRDTKERGEIDVNQQFVDYGEVDDKTGKARHTAYQPCATEQPMIPGLPPGFSLPE